MPRDKFSISFIIGYTKLLIKTNRTTFASLQITWEGIWDVKFNVFELFKTRDYQLFQANGKSSHCLHHLLSPAEEYTEH